MNTSSVFVALSIFISIFYLSTFTFYEVHCAAIDATLTTRSPIIYRRYVRRRPPMEPGDQYVEEFVEVFHTQHKPPAIKNPMSDEDIDKFIFCDFHRETDECKEYWNARNNVGSIERPVDVNPPTAKPPVAPPSSGAKTSKGTISPSTFTTTTSSSTTSTTTPSSPTSSSTSSSSSTTTSSAPTSSAITTIISTSVPEDFIPHIPDIPSEEDIDDIDDNFDDYNGAKDYEDEEDQEDQQQSTTTFRSPFNFFG